MGRVDALRRIHDRAPGARYPYQHGLDALLRGDTDEALRAFTETVEIDTDNVDAYIHIGNLLRERGEASRALHVHRELTVRAVQTPAQQRAIREGIASADPELREERPLPGQP